MLLPFSTEALLDAIDGVAYAVDGNGIILGFSRGPFLPVEGDGVSRAWDSASVVGTSIYAQLHGAEVIESYHMLHAAVWSRGQPAIGFAFRCDAPDVERHMRMSLSLIRNGVTPAAVLYQSTVITEIPRVPLPLFAADLLTSRRPYDGAEPVVKLCSYCQKVAWPVDDDTTARMWIEAAEYCRRGGGSDVMISHSVCEACFGRIVEFVSG